MAVRILLALAVMTILYGCDRSGSAPRPGKKEGGLESKHTTASGPGERETTQQERASASRIKTMLYETHPKKGDLSGKLVFDLDGGIWTLDADGSDLEQLHGPFIDPANTDEAPFPPMPSWSPHGEKISFYKTSRKCREEDSSATAKATGSASAEPTASPRCAFVMDADGSNQKLLHDEPVSGGPLSWSPDGKQIAYPAATGGTYVMNADGSGTPSKLVGADYYLPDWSPDGKRIVVEGEGDAVYIMNVARTGVDTDESVKPTRFPTAGVDAHEPVWSPDGTEIAFSGSRGVNSPDIYKMNADGSGRLHRLTDSPHYHSHPTWSPDGEKIAYVRTTQYPDSAGIYVVDSEGTLPTLIKRLDGTAEEVYSLDWR